MWGPFGIVPQIFPVLCRLASLLGSRRVRASGPGPQRVCFFAVCASPRHLSLVLGCSRPFPLNVFGHLSESGILRGGGPRAGLAPRMVGFWWGATAAISIALAQARGRFRFAGGRV